MLAYLFEHVVEEAKASLYVALACAVEVYAHGDVCFLGGASNLHYTFASKEYLGYLLPSQSVLAQYQGLAAKVLSQLGVSLPVAYDERVGEVILRVVDIVLEHPRARLAVGVVVGREVVVNQYVVKLHSFAFQGLQYEVVHRPEGVLWERVGSQAVLV